MYPGLARKDRRWVSVPAPWSLRYAEKMASHPDNPNGPDQLKRDQVIIRLYLQRFRIESFKISFDSKTILSCYIEKNFDISVILVLMLCFRKSAATETYANGNARSPKVFFQTYCFQRTAENFLVPPLWEKREKKVFDFLFFFPQPAAQFVFSGCKLSTR